MPKHHGFPAPRGRPLGPPAAVAEKYDRYDGTDGFVAVADTDTEVIVFSGKPDNIVLTARVGDALVTLTDRVGREQAEIVVLAGATVETRISRERVVARERVAAGGAELAVIGKWAAPPEAA